MNKEVRIIHDKCDLICNIFNTTASFVSPESHVLFKINTHLKNPLYNTNKKINIVNFDSQVLYTIPIIRKTPYFEKFIVISALDQGTFIGNIIIGPFLTATIPKENINGIINDAHAFFQKNEVFQYYNSVSNLTLDKLVHASILINWLINGEYITQKDLLEYNKDVIYNHKDFDQISIEEKLATAIPTYRNRLFEKEILAIVEEGRVESLKNPIFLKEEGSAAFFSEIGYLRSLKTHIITLITLVTRSAIDGGLNTEEAFQLNDHFLRKLERLNTIEDVKKLAGDMLYSFTSAVNEATFVKYSKSISTCINYVIQNLHSNLSHEQIASHVNLSPKYLSVLFKKEVGMSLTDYIRRKRIEEAKRLLQYSKASIPDICSYLNFYDQSYFTKVFKSIVGVTPRYYRENQTLKAEAKNTNY